MAKKSIPQPDIRGKPISLGKASKKYDIPVSSLSDWVARGELTVLKKPELRGQPLLVDEASVVLAMVSRKRGYRVREADRVALQTLPPPGEQRTLDTAELAEEYHTFGETVGFKKDTLEKNRQILRTFTEKCPTLPLSPQPILKFINELPVGKTRKKTYFQVIRAFYNHLVDFHGITTPLTRRMVPRIDKPEFRVLSREDVMKAINSTESFQERLMIELLYSTRIRVGELVSLTQESVFPDHIEVIGKTGKWEVPISEAVYAELQMLGKGALFLNAYGAPMSRDGVYHRVEKLMKRIGITGPKRGPHTLRHTSLTHLYEDTGDIPLVQEAARHADIRMTMEYTHPRAVKQREKLLQHEPLKKLQEKEGTNGQKGI